MAFIVIPPGDVDQGSVIDESLMSGKIKNDLDDLNARTVALESMSGGGGGSNDAESVFATIISGGETNEAKFWKLRHYPGTTNLTGHTDPAGADFEGKDTRERFLFDSTFGDSAMGFSGSDAALYMGTSLYLGDGKQMQFKIKKGENFFCIGTLYGSTHSSNTKVYIDGINANTYGLKDETGATVPSLLNQNSATAFYGKVYHYYGLDGEEHLITVRNENGSASDFFLNFVDIGYRSNDFAIDHKVKLNTGIAQVGAVAASFEEGEFTFTEPTEGLAGGYTGMLKINEAGVVTKVDGKSPARTEIKPNTTVNFSSAVTTLPVKNHYLFPNNGICFFQMPDGSKWFFSYNAKGDPGGPQDQSIDSILWQLQPNENFTFLPDKASTTYDTNEIRGDGRIEYWAHAPILIDSTNNKIDFEITQNGVTTSHTATIPSGRYSADLVPLGAAIKRAMQTVKAIRGNYLAEWSEDSQYWTVGVNDPEVSAITFEWATGANSASSLGPTIGFASDSTGAKTYVASTVKQHKAQRLYIADPSIRSAIHPTIKYNWNEDQTQDSGPALALVENTPGLTAYRRFYPGTYTGTPALDIYPDDDCCGITVFLMKESPGTYITAIVDSLDKVMLGTTARTTDTVSPDIGALTEFFVSFPKGTHRISLFPEEASYYSIQSTAGAGITFFGYRQHYTKPPWESLTRQERVLKTFEIAPKRLFATYYGHNSATYTPQPTNDNINSITESGTWNQITGPDVWNQRYRYTNTLNGYVEVEFVLQGDGGGIAFQGFYSSTGSLDAVLFVSDTTINETTDLVERDVLYAELIHYDIAPMCHLGLKAGTYKARLKTQHASDLSVSAIIIYDTVPPQLNAPTLTQIANTGQSLAMPLHVRRRAGERYGSHLIPEGVNERTYKRGVVTHFDYRANTDIEYQGPTLNLQNMPMYWATYRNTEVGDYMQYTTFCRSLLPMGSTFDAFSPVIQPSVDGRNLSLVSAAEDTKNGFAPTTTRYAIAPLVSFDFQAACTLSASLTYTIADTRGLRTGKAILVDNTGAKEEVYIASFVTDTSFTISKALSVLTPANIVRVLFWGMHNIRVTCTDTLGFYLNGYIFEPLPIEESILRTRVSTETTQEYVALEQALASTAGVVIQYFSLPLHSDGEYGDQKSTDVIPLVNLPSATERLTFRVGGYVPTAGTTAKTISVRSIRQIIKNFDLKVRG